MFAGSHVDSWSSKAARQEKSVYKDKGTSGVARSWGEDESRLQQMQEERRLNGHRRGGESIVPVGEGHQVE